jgi:hypothetical protein
MELLINSHRNSKWEDEITQIMCSTQQGNRVFYRYYISGSICKKFGKIEFLTEIR